MNSIPVPNYEDMFHTVTESAQTRGGPWHVTNVFADSMCIWNQITQQKRFYPVMMVSGSAFKRAVDEAIKLNAEQWYTWWHQISPVPDIKRCFSYYHFESYDGHVVVIGCAKHIKGFMETGLILPCSLDEGIAIINDMNKIFGVDLVQHMEISASTL